MAYQYGAVTVGSSPTLILASNNARKTALIYNNGNAIVYIGLDGTVTSSTGMPLLPQSNFDSSNIYAGWRGAFYGITGTGSSDMRYSEWEG